MRKPNDLSRSLTVLKGNSTLIAVIEMSQSSWLVAGIVPGVERQPLKKVAVDASALLKLLNRWREEAEKAGCRIERIAAASFAFAQEMPDQDGKFSSGRDGGDVLSAPSAHALEEGPRRARHTRRRPCRLHQHAAGVSASLLGDPSMVSRSWSGLPDTRIEAEIADKLEALGRADRRHDR
jgi:hypothetical protein